MIYERCCGLDVHKSSIAACALISGKGKTQEETRRFGTMTSELRELAGWLQQKGIRHVAMESTGVYWKPVWNILEPAGFELLLANAQEVKVVPGRKTDQKDSQWIADLHKHGLLRKSFVPPRAMRDLRDLTRTRGGPDPGAQCDMQPYSEGMGGRQHQVGFGGQRRIWRFRARDAAGFD
jgi:transposase